MPRPGGGVELALVEGEPAAHDFRRMFFGHAFGLPADFADVVGVMRRDIAHAVHGEYRALRHHRLREQHMREFFAAADAGMRHAVEIAPGEVAGGGGHAPVCCGQSALAAAGGSVTAISFKRLVGLQLAADRQHGDALAGKLGFSFLLAAHP